MHVAKESKSFVVLSEVGSPMVIGEGPAAQTVYLGIASAAALHSNREAVPASEIKTMGDRCMLGGSDSIFVAALSRGNSLKVLVTKDGEKVNEIDPESAAFNIHNRTTTAAVDVQLNFKMGVKAWFAFVAAVPAASVRSWYCTIQF